MNLHHQQHLLIITIILLSTHIFPSFTQSVDDSIHDTIYDGCGDYKQCFGHGFSEDCVDNRDCLSVGTVYKKGIDYIFEMKGQKGNGYVAAGLSTDGRMGDDSVVECVAKGNEVKTYMSYTGLFDVSRDGVPQDTAKLITSYIIDNTIYCRVAWPAVSQVKALTFDLTQSDYHVLFVSGAVKSEYSLDYHNVKFYSPAAVKFSALKDTNDRNERKKRSSSDDIYEECRKSEYTGCFGLEDNCVDNEACSPMAVVNQHEDIQTFQLVSFIGFKYISLGFSEQSTMQDDVYVFECINNGGKVNAFFSRYSTRSLDKQPAMTLRSSSLSDKRLYCLIDFNNTSNMTSISSINKKRFFSLSAGHNSQEKVESKRASLVRISLLEHRSYI
ncbi:hypothetical protein ACKWTF_015132 [Chironomus riparius]